MSDRLPLIIAAILLCLFLAGVLWVAWGWGAVHRWIDRRDEARERAQQEPVEARPLALPRLIRDTWRDAEPDETPGQSEPDDAPAQDPHAYVGRHRAIGAGWGTPGPHPLCVTVPPIDWRARTGEWELQLATWAADLGEPVRGQVTYAEVFSA